VFNGKEIESQNLFLKFGRKKIVNVFVLFSFFLGKTSVQLRAICMFVENSPSLHSGVISNLILAGNN